MYITICKMGSQWDLLCDRELNPRLRDKPEGWEVGGKFKREGTCVYLWLIHVAVWQKPRQHWKVIILKYI